MNPQPRPLSDQIAPVREWLAGRRPFDRDAAPIYLAILAMVAFLIVAVNFLGFRYDHRFADGSSLALGFFLCFAVCARWIGFSRAACIVEAWVLLILASALTALSAFVAAALDRPLVDTALAGWDLRLFGFSRDMIPRFAADWPLTFKVTVGIYDTLSLQPFILLALLFALGRRRHAWTILLAWTFAMVICLIMSPLAPARGTPPYPFDFVPVLDGVRSGALRTIDADDLTGIINFPSFHAAGAVVLAWGWAGIRPLRVPLIALNAAMAVSAVIVGSHYIVDVLAGIVVAGVAIQGAKSCYGSGFSRWRRPSPRFASSLQMS